MFKIKKEEEKNMLKLNENNIKELTKNKKVFLDYAKKSEEIFTGPSKHFYLRTILYIRKKEYTDLLSGKSQDSFIFFDYLYATLTSWGMNRMDKHTRMAEFNIFKETIIKNRDKFSKFHDKKIRSTNIEDIEEDLIEIFKSMKIMARENAPKLVAHSKIMHFLLPDLVPPIDKSHVVFFFYGEWKKKKNSEKYYKKIPSINKTKEEGIFIEIIKHFKNIANKLNLNEKDLKNEWNTSIPKLIDNAIIGYNNYILKK